MLFHSSPLASHELKVKIYAERLLKQLESVVLKWHHTAFIIIYRVSFRRTEQLGEAEQVNQDILDIRCLQVCLKLLNLLLLILYIKKRCLGH